MAPKPVSSRISSSSSAAASMCKGAVPLMVASVVLALVAIASLLVGCRNPAPREGFSGAAATWGELRYFKMEGCGHCKNFDGVWPAVQDAAKAEGLKTRIIMSTEDEANTNGVRGYPTIQLHRDSDDSKHVFDGSRTAAGIAEWIGTLKQPAA